MPHGAREAWVIRLRDSVEVLCAQGVGEGEAVAQLLDELSHEARTIPQVGRRGFPAGLALLWGACLAIVLYLCYFVGSFWDFYAGVGIGMPAPTLPLIQAAKVARQLWPLAALALTAMAVIIVFQWIGRWPRYPRLERFARILGSVLYLLMIASLFALFLPFAILMRHP